MVEGSLDVTQSDSPSRSVLAVSFLSCSRRELCFIVQCGSFGLMHMLDFQSKIEMKMFKTLTLWTCHTKKCM